MDGSSPASLVLSAIAVLVSIVAIGLTLHTARRESHRDTYEYLGTLWNDILALCYQYPQYLDIRLTEHYESLMSDLDRSRYDVYCYQAWGHVEDIVVKGFENDQQFRAVIHWTVAYHLRWVERNPTFFPLKTFWDTIEQVKEEPQLLLRYQALPHKDGDIDWDLVCEDYYRYILSPLDPAMVAVGPQGRRNVMLEELLALPYDELASARVADFGCGPGNLLPHLAGRVRQMTGVDLSQASLARAALVAADNGIEFKAVHGDLRSIRMRRKFDIIVCSNAILPPDRADVAKMLETVRQHLAPGGRLFATLSSYDTTTYLHRLWYDHYVELLGDADHAGRIVRALVTTKRADDELHQYADDGKNVQSYHTPETILEEFTAAGLTLSAPPKKMYYPWKLTQRFDYGYFPDAPEEIWDWYVQATV